MKSLKSWLFLLLAIIMCCVTSANATLGEYVSSHENIQWDSRSGDTFYCIDIFDHDWNMLHQAVNCGENLHNYSPQDLGLASGTYHWKVWSSTGYGGDGFEGEFSVSGDCAGLNYQSTYASIQWGCRNDDTFYCIDILDSNWNMLRQAAICGENVHSYSPQELGLASGTYHWKVWSSTGYGGDGFEGEFSVSGDCAGLDYSSTDTSIQWGCRDNDTFYSIDIFDYDWNMVHQAAKNGEGVHSFTPQELNLSSGIYHWKVWSSNGYGGDGFEGSFVVQYSYPYSNGYWLAAKSTDAMTDKIKCSLQTSGTFEDGRIAMFGVVGEQDTKYKEITVRYVLADGSYFAGFGISRDYTLFRIDDNPSVSLESIVSLSDILDVDDDPVIFEKAVKSTEEFLNQMKYGTTFTYRIDVVNFSYGDLQYTTTLTGFPEVLEAFDACMW